MNMDIIERAKRDLKMLVNTSWINWCVENGIDWDKCYPVISDFGTKFTVQMPERLIFQSGEEE
tara:strand:+ start:3786 stop:3974 length:189 start_codon:yes stop_codon:yes gene_type:complete